jgi:hypothetical protein
MVQGGDRYLMTEAMVVRRGTTFHIGGPSDADLAITGSGLTSLTGVKDPCGGGWTVSVPSNGTVGTYAATVSLGDWNKSMPLYVLFQVPSPSPSSEYIYNLTQEHIEAFLYDDDSSNLRDETSVWFYAPEDQYSMPCSDPPDDSPCSEWDYHWAKGYAQAFWTDLFQKYVFLDHAMPAIHGYTAQTSAANAVAAWADKEFKVNFDGLYDSFAAAMYTWPVWVEDRWEWAMYGGACQDNANIFTTMLRSAGIAARPFLKDYNKTPGHGEGGAFDIFYQYDHSVMIWVDNHWKGGRSYTGGESGYYPWDGGYRPHMELYRYYDDVNSDLIISTNEGWDWASDGGMVNDLYFPSHEDVNVPGTYDYGYWYSHNPLEIPRSPYVDILNYEFWHGDDWAPSEWRDPDTDPDYDSLPSGRVATQTYDLPPGVPAYVGDLENWPYNPVPIACSPSWYEPGWEEECPYDGGGLSLGVSGMSIEASARPALGTQPALQTQSDLIQLGAMVDDYGLDLDGNGRFDELIVEFEVNVAQAGDYTFGGALELGEDMIDANYARLHLGEGVQTVQLSFDGQAIGRKGVDGPYQVVALWVTDLERFDRDELWDNLLDYQQPDYATAPYAADQFETLGALFADVYSHRGLDNDGDGRYEAVAIDVVLDIALPGTYQVEGDLYDGEGNFVGHATWSGSGSVAPLVFELEKTTPPYKLEHLRLIDSGGPLLDSRHRNVYTITDLGGLVDWGAATMDLYLPESGGIAPLGLTITPTQVFDDRGVDLDGDGLYDQLVIDVEVEVSAAGPYRIEGWLEGPDGSLIVYAISGPTDLGTGLQTLSLAFDGRAINGRGMDGPYTVIALRILDGTAYDVLDEVQVTGLELAYDAADFEPATDVPVVFSDDVSDTDNWNWGSPWSRTSSVWYSPSYAWQAYASGSQSGWLRTMSIVVPELTRPFVGFQGCYALGANDYGYVELSVNDEPWTTVLTYTNGTKLWYSEGAKLDSTDEITSLKARFRLSSDGSGTAEWYIDDVIITAGGEASIYLPIIMK